MKKVKVSGIFEVTSIEPAVSIKSVSERYLLTTESSGVTIDGHEWSAILSNPTIELPYLWNYEIIEYTNGHTSTTAPHIASIFGKAIKNVTERYGVSANNNQYPESWSVVIPNTDTTNRYLWNSVLTEYSDGTFQYVYRIIAIHGEKGDKGDTGDIGIGISSVVEYYLASTAASGVTVSTTGWTTTVQTITATKKYLWNYEVINYTNGGKTTTTPVIIGTYGEKGDTGDKGPSGPQGERGPMERVRKWEAGATYTAGGVGEDYGDIVYEDGSSIPYECVVSHTAVDGYPPSVLATHSNPSMRYWRIGAHRYMLATDIMLSRLIMASEIDVTSLIAKRLETIGDAATVCIQNGIIEIFGSANKAEPNIRFGVNESGCAVLQYYDNSGKFLYDLGPNGLSSLEVREEKWITFRRKYLGTDEETVIQGTNWKNTLYTSGTDIYKYVSQIIGGLNQNPAKDGLFFNSPYTTGVPVNGWYCPVASQGAGTDDSAGMIPSIEFMRDASIYQPTITNKSGYAIYFKNLEYYQDGVRTRIQPVYWAVPTSNVATPIV